MTKIKTVFLLMIALLISVFVAMGATLTASADAAEPGETVTEENVPEEDEGSIVDAFIAMLKDKYGADYEFYYNQIIEQWGSVEEYLLSLGEQLPEDYRTAWQKFVGWLGEYAPIWATALAIVIVIIVTIIGKKAFDKIMNKIVNSKVAPIVDELNLQSTAMISNIRALKALLGNNEKFAETVKELDDAERELKNG